MFQIVSLPFSSKPQQTKAWFPLMLFTCCQQNFLHGTCAEWWNEQNRTKNIFHSVRIWSSKISTSGKFSCSKTNQTSFLSHVDVSWGSKNFLQNGYPTALSGLREDRPQYALKTRIIELQTSFRFWQFFTGTLRKWRLIFLQRYFSLTKNSISDSRKVWMEIRLKKISTSKTAWIISILCKMSHRYLH